jgi:exopolysaccharide biosynthesis protein
MINKREMTYLGQTVHIIEGRNDLNDEVQISVCADKYSSVAKKQLSQFRDEELESQGFILEGIINGGLFFTESGVTFAEGIEKSKGNVHEIDDRNLDTCMGLYHNNGLPFIALQSYIIANLSKYRGALTGAFGLLNNGLTDTRGRSQRSTIFNAKSGRSIIGKKPDGTILLVSFQGVTGESGLTGEQCVSLARYLGMNNALCLDGGGSTQMRYKGVSMLYTGRELKNAIALYRKSKCLQVGDKVVVLGTHSVDSVNGSMAQLSDMENEIEVKFLKVV